MGCKEKRECFKVFCYFPLIFYHEFWLTIFCLYPERAAEKCFCYTRRMIRRRWLPYNGDVGFVGLLKSCAKEKDLQKGTKIHSNIREHYRCLEMSLYIANSLISMYAKCGDFPKAREVLEEIPTRNVVSWNALISGYTHQDQFDKALKCFEEIEHEGLFPDEITFICMLKCCGRTRAIEKGKWIHDQIMKSN